MQRRTFLALGAAGLAAPWMSHDPASGDSAPGLGDNGMVEAALALLAAVDAGQRTRLQRPVDDDDLDRWYYVPNDSVPGKLRKGLSLEDMSEAQRSTAMRLLATGLSEQGLQKAATVRQLELVLKAIEQSDRRNPDRYYFTIFGTPSPAAPWSWRYEGHHCSQHWTLVPDAAGRVRVATLPQFFGANPAEVRSGPLLGTRLLAREEDVARELVFSLDDPQRKLAITSDVAPADIVTGNRRQVGILQETGVAYSDLRPDQQGMVVAILEELAGAHHPTLAAQRLARVRQAGLQVVRFAWMGALDRGQGHYYRLQGKTFLIEHDNTQDGANHVHNVWRDFDGDFGRDLLAEHLAEHDHAAA